MTEPGQPAKSEASTLQDAIAPISPAAANQSDVFPMLFTC